MSNDGLTAIQIGEDIFPIDFSQHNHDDRYPIISGDGENSAVQKGSNNIASGVLSIALGKDSNAEGNYSFASGNSVASGEYSHAEGVAAVENGVTRLTKAIGKASHAEGEGCHASATGAHAEGMWTDASKNGAHAEGYKTVADAQYSHAEGNESHTTGNISHAEGKGTHAIGRASHTEGWYTIANNESEHASGRFNVSTKSSDKSQATQFSIGIGTSATKRKNAFEVKQNGDIYIEGVSTSIQQKLNKSINSIIDITYGELKDLRDNSKLFPGQQYCITDYVTKTAQTNTKSAGNPFNIIVTALDDHTLSENASAVRSDRDNGYFETENLEAWKLKYCLDNDTERFLWADTGVPEWYSKIVSNYTVDQSNVRQPYSLDQNYYIYDYGTSTHPDTGEDSLVFWTEDPIYYENFGVDYSDTYYYNGIVEVDGVEYDSWIKHSNGNWVEITTDNGNSFLYALTERVVYDNVFVWPDNSNLEKGKGVIYNMIDEYGNECPYDFKNIKFYHNGLGTDVYTFTWINENYEVMDTSVFGNNGTLTCYGEIYGVYGNVIKPYMDMIYDENSEEYLGTKQSLNNITFISDYEYEWMGNDGFYGCYNNSFGNSCHNNSFGNYCFGNSFGNGCNYNSFGDSCYYNSFGNGFRSNPFGNGCHNNSFGNGCNYNSFGDSCSSNSFGNDCYSNTFGNYCHNNSFGNNCNYNSFRLSASTTGTLLIYCQNNHFDNGCSYNVIWNSVQPTFSNKLQNIHVARGVSGTSSAYNFINIVDKNISYEIKVAKNSRGDIKIYCEADLIA